MKLRPLSSRVLVLPDEAEGVSKGGIIIPDVAKEKPARGTVVAVGPGMLKKDGERWPMPVEPGEKVLYSKYAGTEVKLDGKMHVMMRDDDLIAVIDDRKAAE